MASGFLDDGSSCFVFVARCGFGQHVPLLPLNYCDSPAAAVGVVVVVVVGTSCQHVDAESNDQSRSSAERVGSHCQLPLCGLPETPSSCQCEGTQDSL